MGYNIELSFNVLKNSSGTELLNDVRDLAEECFCENFYEDYEFENKTRYKRNHCIITINFLNEQINYMIKFLNIIKKNKIYYIETIYDENNHSILYASQYFITQKMNKKAAKDFKNMKRKRSYSDDENMILNTVLKQF